MLRTVACSIALLASLASAQTLNGAGRFVAVATAGNARDSKTAPFPGSVQAYASELWSQANAAVSGSLSGLTASFSTYASGSNPFNCTAEAHVDVTFKLSAAKPTSGVLLVSVAQGRFDLDIGLRRKFVPITGTRRIAASIGPAGLSFRVLVGAIFPSPTLARSSGTVQFVPTASEVQAYGPSCPVELQSMWWRESGSDTLVLQTDSAPSTPFAFLLLGTNRLNVPLPPTNCPLLTDFPFVQMIPTVLGTNQSWIVAPSFRGVTFYAQVVGADPTFPLRWRTSNGIKIQLP